jgi:hypothetical protein
MVKRKHIIIILLVLLIGIVAAVYCFQGEAKKIRKQFTLLSELASKDGDEGNLTMARRAHQISRLFAEKCDIKANLAFLSGTYARQEISGLAARARSQFSRLSVRFYDLNIEFPDEDTATVTVTGRASGTLRGGEAFDDVLELECSLRKFDDSWLFTTIEAVEVLEK